MSSHPELKGFIPHWLRFNTECYFPHQIFFKEHSVRNQEPEYPKGRTLFVVNIPPWATSGALKKTFAASCGAVQTVTLSSEQDSSSGFGKAYIVFQRESALDKALSFPYGHRFTLHKNKAPGVHGLQKWCREYNESLRQDEQAIKTEIEEYMREYDERAARLSKREENGEEGEDGWTTVTSKKKRGQFAPGRKESTIGKLQSKEERKNKKKELLNFYTFQIREAKKKNIVDLRKKFELDKKKLQQIKSKRTFKPF